MNKKNFLAQNYVGKYKIKYFFTLEEAKDWLMKNGGGIIKKRSRSGVWEELLYINYKDAPNPLCPPHLVFLIN